MLPEQDEPSGLDNVIDCTQETGSLPTLDSSASFLDGVGSAEDTDIDLDPGFVDNYEEWLQNNVYDSDIEEVDRNNDNYYSYYSSANFQNDNAATPGTPIPSSPIMAPYADEPPTHNIHNLYKQGLEEAFSQGQTDSFIAFDKEGASSGTVLDPMKKVAYQLLAAEQRTIERYSDLSENSASSVLEYP